MSKILRNSIKIVEWGIFMLMLMVLFLVASPLLPTEKYLSTYVVATGSMEPSILTGSLVGVVPSSSYSVGDIVLFESPEQPGQTIVHRISSDKIASNERKFITKGDNNDSEDPWLLSEESVKGKVMLTVPHVGKGIEWAKTPAGFGVMLIIPALLFGLFQFIRINDGINEEVEKRLNVELSKRSKSTDNLTSGSKASLFIIIIISCLTFIPFSLAKFSSTAQANGMIIQTADYAEPEFEFDGGLSVFNKTNNTSLNIDEFNARSGLDVNIVFRPIELPANAHHFTIIMQDMSDGRMVHYRTMLSRWTMENYTKDGHLGYTVWYEGEFWLQVNSYDQYGEPAGEFYAILEVAGSQPEQEVQTVILNDPMEGNDPEVLIEDQIIKEPVEDSKDLEEGTEIDTEIPIDDEGDETNHEESTPSDDVEEISSDEDLSIGKE